MQQTMEGYFRAEQAESLLFAAFGILAIGLSAYLLWRHGDALSKGLAIPLVLVGLIQLTVGGTVYLRTPGQLAALAAQHRTEPARFRAEETARMAKVMANFTTYKWIEVAFIVTGLAVTLFVSQPFWLGIGMGMLVQGALMLPADITAAQRGAVYQAAVGGVE